MPCEISHISPPSITLGRRLDLLSLFSFSKLPSLSHLIAPLPVDIIAIVISFSLSISVSVVSQSLSFLGNAQNRSVLASEYIPGIADLGSFRAGFI